MSYHKHYIQFCREQHFEAVKARKFGAAAEWRAIIASYKRHWRKW